MWLADVFLHMFFLLVRVTMFHVLVPWLNRDKCSFGAYELHLFGTVVNKAWVPCFIVLRANFNVAVGLKL